MKMLALEELQALVPGIESMGIDEARAAIKALGPHLLNPAIHCWNEHYGRALHKDVHKAAKAKRSRLMREARSAARAAAKAAAPAKKGKG